MRNPLVVSLKDFKLGNWVVPESFWVLLGVIEFEFLLLFGNFHVEVLILACFFFFVQL